MRTILLFAASMILMLGAHAQTSKVKFGKGFYYLAADSSISTKFQMRFQTLYEANVNNGALGDEDWLDNFSDKMLIRRARFKFSGHVYSPKLTYKTEFGLTARDMGAKQPDGDKHFNGAASYILDAVLKWNFYKNMSLWVGQTKLPGNRERVISSANLQFVDRSQVNSRFNIDRDKGVHLRHHFTIGNMVFREIFAFSMGEGRNVTSTDNRGKSYTGRIEWLPFGKFKSKGDYSSSDLKREQSPKLALGANWNLNQRAKRQGGQLGSFVADSLLGDITTIHADLMFKYSGISVMAEYGNRDADDGNSYRDVANPYYTGEGISAQLGYLFKSNWEPALRYTVISPDAVNNSAAADFTEYTLGVSKYIVGHKLKVQSDVSLTDTDKSDKDNIRYRLQVEMQF